MYHHFRGKQDLAVVVRPHALAGHPERHTPALADDPRDWRLPRFTLWHHEAPADEPADEPTGERYEVLHPSAPELDQLPSKVTAPTPCEEGRRRDGGARPTSRCRSYAIETP